MSIKENIYGHKKKLEFILNVIKDYSKSNSKPSSEMKILDFGCGNGTAVSFEVAALGVQLTGVDFHSDSINFANANNRFPNAKFVHANEDTILELGEYFDVIICSDVIEHLPDPESTLKKIRDVHKDGGILVGAIPNGYGPFEIEKFVSKWTRLEWIVGKAFGLASKIKRGIIKKQRGQETDKIPYNMECTHCQFFRLRDFYKLMREIRYRPLEFRNGAFLGAPVSEKFLGFKRFIEWNIKIADKLPPQLVSTWYFVCEKIS